MSKQEQHAHRNCSRYFPSEQNVVNCNIFTYKAWLIRAGMENKGTIETYNAWLEGIDPATFRAK